MYRTTYDENTKLWSGSTNAPLYNPNISIAHFVLRYLRLHGSRTAQVSFLLQKKADNIFYKDVYKFVYPTNLR